MGGEMHVKSTQGKGSTFDFTSLHDPPTKEELVKFLRESNFPDNGLPTEISPGEAKTPTPKATLDSLPPKFRMIGVAEDNPINLQYIARHLKMLGYQYTLCANGKEMLDKFCKPDGAIDCCILDMSMPVMGKCVVGSATMPLTS
jgi:PleD family two-component response regulator